MPEVGGISQGGVIAVAEIIVTWGIWMDVRLSQDCWALAEAVVNKKTVSKHTNKHKYM
jgi:hypothetical protein